MARKNDYFVVVWKIQDEDGNWMEVDPFTFVKEALGIPKRTFKKLGLESIIGGPGGSIGRKDFKAYIKVINTAAKNGQLSARSHAAGLKKLTDILNSKTEKSKLAEKAYNYNGGGGVIYELKAYLKRQNADMITSKPRPKSAIRVGKGGRRLISTREKRDYSGRWQLIVNTILGKPHASGGRVYSFSLSDLMKVQVNSLSSNLKSVFMMEEFGTGMFADTPRPFQSISTTPWKVPPQMVELWGGSTSMWWSAPFLRAWAYRLYSQFIKGKGSQQSWMRQVQKLHKKKFSIKEFREYKLRAASSYKQYTSMRKEDLGKERKNPVEWAFGANTESSGILGREARHLFFNKDGITQDIRIIQQKASERLLLLLDEEIHIVSPTFPSLYRQIFGDRGYLAYAI